MEEDDDDDNEDDYDDDDDDYAVTMSSWDLKTRQSYLHIAHLRQQRHNRKLVIY
jgi:hypothetical protein